MSGKVVVGLTRFLSFYASALDDLRARSAEAASNCYRIEVGIGVEMLVAD
jgi:hypothetical protein